MRFGSEQPCLVARYFVPILLKYQDTYWLLVSRIHVCTVRTANRSANFRRGLHVVCLPVLLDIICLWFA